jgi:hypothetical protein
LKEYLPALTESGLLRYDVDSRRFRTTKKVLDFLIYTIRFMVSSRYPIVIITITTTITSQDT